MVPLEAILYRASMNDAYRRVVANGGSAGVDSKQIRICLPTSGAQSRSDGASRVGKRKPLPVRRSVLRTPGLRAAR